jgi:hypothetical protein
MIIDAQLMFSDAQALVATAASTNIYDAGSDRNLGLGEPLAVQVTVDVAAVAGTLTISLQTDDNAGFASPTTVATTAAIAAAALTLGAKVILPVPPDTAVERYLRLMYTFAGMTSVTVTAFLTPAKLTSSEGVYYADAITITG